MLDKYYKLLGLHINDVKEYFDKKNINYTIKTIEGKKNKENLLVPRAIKISEIDNSVEIVITYFSDSLD
ncbi:hypothetical protein [Asaccharospora irregularis]|uniref:PASTA domain-containing protein n=1 Tax=Asaccharospora irregularis DSM 2635 TaxID=1121321 RepID=A0A1M5Q5G6_9FIRM|nr:hypothetical protein [Asaccharospora irregularis]SHH08753.1 hypothetical protein SAMN04488530_11823 [Asaccharospora irregularis DSM 2635]